MEFEFKLTKYMIELNFTIQCDPSRTCQQLDAIRDHIKQEWSDELQVRTIFTSGLVEISVVCRSSHNWSPTEIQIAKTDIEEYLRSVE
jgi:hypothetical protein